MEELAKNQMYTVTIDGYASDGSGVCRIGGRAVFVKGAISGEQWQIKLLKVTNSAVFAKGETLLEPSRERIASACQNFGKCGGCDLLHMSYEEELRFKLDRVNDAFRRIGGFDFKVSRIIGADSIEGYRNKAVYSVGEYNGDPVCGFYRPRSHDIISAPHCQIQAEHADRAASAVLRWMKKNRIAVYDESEAAAQHKRGLIRRIFARYAFGTGQLQICVVSAAKLRDTGSLVDEILATCPETVSIVLNINDSIGNTVLAGDFYTLWGSDTITDILCGLRFELSPLSFYQINPKQAERLYETAVGYASSGNASSPIGTVVDLYCGTGTITLYLAHRAEHVIGIELSESAVADARKNAARNGIANVEFIRADASSAASVLNARGVHPDVVIADPPRKGLSRDMIDAILEISPARFVYVSCDPATLARDLRLLDSYTPIEATCVDMFPRTRHAETVVLMSKTDCLLKI